MKDERLMKEMNQIKGQVSLYVSIATLVLGLIKFFIYGFDFSFFYVEIFILAVTSIMFIVVLMNITGTYDERTDQNIKTIYQYGFIVLFLGGLWTHFYQVYVNLADKLVVIYITNTLILIGFIVTLILLKKKSLYANYKYIEYDKKKYYLHIALNIFRLLLIMASIYGSLMVIFGFPGDMNILLIFIIMSFIMISFEYILFSIYEKNHYDEMIRFENENPNMLSNNVFVFQILIFIFTTLSSYAALRVTMISINYEHFNHESLLFWATISNYLQIMSLDFLILGFIATLIAYKYLVKLLGENSLLKVFLIVGIIKFVHQVLNLAFSLFMPVIERYFETSQEFFKAVMTYNQINLVIVSVITVIYIGFAVILYFRNVKYKYFVLFYALINAVSHPFVINQIYRNDHPNYYIASYVLNTLSAIILLVLIGLFAHTRYQQSTFKVEEVLIEA